ncbi:hypothetical protein BRD00_02660 [Halobacteriales archaeon QS_8_69_26]|nr:MAG: hypothetical protein BRD00_02660 [Halobacteriales archaeon QS_8_69_26]
MPSPTESPDGLRCYDCGHRYSYLGPGVHPGRCPDCGGRGVSPAGTLRVAEDPFPVGRGLRVDAIDATGRTFGYWVASLSDGIRAQLVRVRVASTIVAPSHDAWPDDMAELVPDALADRVRAADMHLTAPASVVG